MNDPILDQLRELTRSRQIKEYLEYCLSIRGDAGVPVYEDFNPLDLPSIVPQLFILDIRRGWDTGLHIKFSGTTIDDHFGRNVQAMTLEEVYRGDPERERLIGKYHRCANAREVFFRQRDASFEWERGDYARGAQDMLIVPMTSRDEPDLGVGTEPSISYLCGFAAFESSPDVVGVTEAYLALTALGS